MYDQLYAQKLNPNTESQTRSGEGSRTDPVRGERGAGESRNEKRKSNRSDHRSEPSRKRSYNGLNSGDKRRDNGHRDYHGTLVVIGAL